MTDPDDGVQPRVDPTAWVAPDATVSGDVEIGPGCRVMPGARIVAESGGRLRIGRCCIVLENAVVRATGRHACSIGDYCVIGPHAHVVGATLDGRAFVATGASIFHGAHLAEGVEVRINAVVHIATALSAGTTVPIGWVAVGTPAGLFPPDRHDEIWARQQPLDFPRWVYGVERSSPDIMRDIAEAMSTALAGRKA